MRKYDIQTLLALSQNARIELNKFSDQAVGNHLLRPHPKITNPLVEQSVNQSRTASNISQQTEGSQNIPSHSHYPSRPPKDPPQSKLAQTNAGFARFLKEHTSPKHQRVTAGGRIVPMDLSQSPVPKMRSPVNNPQSRENNNRARGSLPIYVQDDSTTQMKATKADSNINDAPRNPVMPTGVLPDLARLTLTNNTLDQAFQGPGFSPNLSLAAMTPGLVLPSGLPVAFNNPQVSHIDQQPQVAYLPVLQDPTVCGAGANVHFGLSNTYQNLNLSNPVAPIPTSLQPHLSIPTSSDFSSCSNAAIAGSSSSVSQHQPSYDPFYSTFMTQWYQNASAQAPEPKQPTSASGNIQEAPYRKCLDEAKKQHESLSAQLSRLDRYMALHTWDIDSQSKKVLVEQRKSLVRELDIVRMYREQLDLIFGTMNMNTFNYQEAKSGLPVSSAMYLPETTGAQMPLGLGSSTSNPNYVGQSLPTHLPQNTYPLLYPEIEPLPPVFPWQNAGYPSLYDKEAETSSLIAGGHLRHSDSPYQDQMQKSNSASSYMNKGRQSFTSAASDQSSLKGSDQALPCAPSALDIRHIYLKIEEATKHGEPIDGLLQELSTVTTQLVNQRRQECQAQHRPARDKFAQRSFATNRSDSGKPIPERRSAKHPRQPRATGHLSPKPGKSHIEQVPMPNTELNGEFSSSCVSTTNSWTTSHEGKTWVDMASLNYRGREKDLDRIWQRHQNFPKDKNASELSYKPSSTSTLHCPQKSRTGASGLQATKQATSPLLRQYLSKDKKSMFQKTPALAVPQNVNVQAYVPPFDGTGDMPLYDAGKREAIIDIRQVQDIAASNSPQRKTSWHYSKQCVEPASAVISEFFRRIEDEEDSTIRGHYRYSI